MLRNISQFEEMELRQLVDWCMFEEVDHPPIQRQAAQSRNIPYLLKVLIERGPICSL